MNLKTGFKTKIQKMKTKKTLDSPKTPSLDYPRASRINDSVKEDKSHPKKNRSNYKLF